MKQTVKKLLPIVILFMENLVSFAKSILGDITKAYSMPLLVKTP